MRVIRRFILYGTLGWCLEILWTGLGSFLSGDVRLSATTYLWMFPIYGLAIVFEPLHDKIRHYPWVVRGIVWMSLFFLLEYTTGWLIRRWVGVSPWLYNNTIYAIDGIIRLDYAPVWFTLGLLFERVHDWADRHYFWKT